MSACSEVMDRLRISEVYQALGGPKLQCRRGKAFWRNGDGYSVSLNDARGSWRDFKANEGGGVLDLVVRVRGGSRQDALHWCADLAGVPLEDKAFSSRERAAWARERRELERDLPTARYWKKATLAITEELLGCLKAALLDPTQPQPVIGEIAYLTATLAAVRGMDGPALVAEYHSWAESHPGWTATLVTAAKRRTEVQEQAILAYLGQLDADSEVAA